MVKSVPLADKATIYEYKKLRDLRPGTDIHFYGLITRYKEPYKSRGTDYCMSLAVIDETIPKISGDGTAGAIPVSIFSADPHRLPQVRGIGDVVQFRHFRIQQYNDTVQALSMRQSAWIVYSKDELGVWSAKPEHELSEVELQVIEEIHSGAATEKKEHSSHIPMVYDSQDPLNRLCSISELRPGMSFDLVAQVFKRFTSDRTNQTMILLTDYTENDLLKWDEREEVPKHLTKRLLLVSFWDNFATLAGTLNEGDYVMCKNLTAKTVDSRLVAAMHGNYNLPAEHNILKLADSSPDISTIKRRKENMETLVNNSKHFGSIDITVVGNRSVPTISIMTILSSDKKFGVACIMGQVARVKPKTRIIKNKEYMFELLLRDQTGEIPVIVYGKEAEKFFSCSPADFGREQEKGLELLLASLIPSPFLIKEYTVKGKKRYQLFDTLLNA